MNNCAEEDFTKTTTFVRQFAGKMSDRRVLPLGRQASVADRLLAGLAGLHMTVGLRTPAVLWPDDH